jgi:tetratricopeptide (TPR) repeat protein
VRISVWFSKALHKRAEKQTAAEALKEQTRKFRSLGWAHYIKEDYQSAELDFQHACQGDPDNNLLLGHVYFNSDRYKEAADCYQAAISGIQGAMKKTDSEADLLRKLSYYHCCLGNSYSKQNLIDKALEELDKAQEALSKTEEDANRASTVSYTKPILLDYVTNAYVDLYLSNRQASPPVVLQNANKVSAQALALKPHDGYLHNSLGVVYYHQACAAAETKDNVQAKYFSERATERFKRALNEDAERELQSQFYSDLAVTYDLRARLSTEEDVGIFQQCALDNFKSGLEQDENNQILYDSRADLHSRMKQYTDAINDYLQVIRVAASNGADTAEYHNRLGLVYLAQDQDQNDQEKVQQAIGEFKQAIAERKDSIEPYANLGEAYLRKKQYDEAISKYLEALNIARQANVDIAIYYNLLGLAYDRKGDLVEAVSQYKQAIHESKQADPVFQWNLGYAHYRLKQYDDAVREWEVLVKLESKDASYWNWLGNAYYASENYDKAIQAYKNAVEHAPEQALYRRNLGNACMEGQQIPNAIEAFQRAIERDSEDWTNHYLLGMAYRRSNEFEKARAEYGRALEHAQEKTQTVKIRRGLGLLYQAHNKFDEAIRELEWVRDELPEDIDVRMSLAVAYAGKGRMQDASAEIQAAKKLNPEDARLPEAFTRVHELLDDSSLHSS